MKITALETLCLSRMHEPERQWVTSRYRTVKADCAVVVIHTDAGLTGIGEASAYGWPKRIAEWVDWLSPTLIGKDPTDPAVAPKPNGRGRPHDTAVAGIDCALWDLRGKIAGKKVSELLSPTPADRVRLYASGGCRYDWRHNPEQLIEEALGYVAQGYTAMKFRIGTEWSWDGVTVDRFIGHIRELAQAVNGRMDLALDGNCRLTEEQAMPIALELDRLGFAWLEEPIDRANIAGNARLCAAAELPITGGEAFACLDEFRPYIEAKAYDILQPDAGLSGITETLRIADRAAQFGLPVYPHSWHNGLMCMAHSHLVAAHPNIKIVELCQHQGPLQWGIVKERPQVEAGYLILPDRPGLGVELVDDVAARFPHVEGHYAINVER
ncbi:MAG: mandelate racemase/muconate lactonizing enzyme family protein [Chloroflexi bacterium]|nr:MAG: mandelate racemase/muconate lactonizing enzyme family protein [Chloroflexota bacterium]